VPKGLRDGELGQVKRTQFYRVYGSARFPEVVVFVAHVEGAAFYEDHVEGVAVGELDGEYGLGHGGILI